MSGPTLDLSAAEARVEGAAGLLEELRNMLDPWRAGSCMQPTTRLLDGSTWAHSGQRWALVDDGADRWVAPWDDLEDAAQQIAWAICEGTIRRLDDGEITADIYQELCDRCPATWSLIGGCEESLTVEAVEDLCGEAAEEIAEFLGLEAEGEEANS